MDISNKANTAAVVVLYNPDVIVRDNILSYLPDVSTLYVIDNSEIKNPELISIIKTYPQIKYIANNGNVGLAIALNKGASLAVNDGFKWLLTMDQDSKANLDMLSLMREAIYNLKPTQQIGILSPFHSDKHNHCTINKDELVEVFAVMTSGNLLNLEAYKQAGPFMNKFFIDYIDIEYCLRLRTLGYKIFQANQAVLDHNLGSITEHSLLGKKIGTSNHSPIRRYYITRNSLYVAKIYKNEFPSYCSSILKHFWKEVARVILFEKNKPLKLIYMCKGYWDFRKNKFYKLESNK